MSYLVVCLEIIESGGAEYCNGLENRVFETGKQVFSSPTQFDTVFVSSVLAAVFLALVAAWKIKLIRKVMR